MTPHNPHALPAPFLDQPLAALPEDGTDERLPIFTRDRQTAFLRALAACGVARRASVQAGVSYRTAYRARRAEPAFRRAWDAALLAARAMAEDVLATRAIEGVEEEVWYHGEVVATRRRYDSRLLLAHLARLDKLTEDARTRAFADDYEGALERFAAGCDDPAPVCGTCGDALPPAPASSPENPAGDGAPLSPSGLCDKCDSAARAAAAEAARLAAEWDAEDDEDGADWDERDNPGLDLPCDCVGARFGMDRGRAHYQRGPAGPEPVCNVGGDGPCCAAPSWPGCRDCPHYPRVSRLLNEMEDQRPADVLPPAGDNARVLEALQIAAFEAGVGKWWRITSEDELDAALEALPQGAGLAAAA
ncbi:hypothetical protein [Qipengyuania sp.]|uniref:hypothetical protein n=1 Tax=Qipengyuania sp. TaxID=2004515 RepID=UPI003736D013